MTAKHVNLRVGRPQTTPTKPAHVSGIKEGNAPGNYARQGGHLPNGNSTAERSTGINAGARNPIDPRAPNLSPA
ncbi:MAG TPA: hypothetical protein VFW66_03105 [Gemmatimonadales bacterium]|nr:hypothetical protein [Gemmatimonadales bacterium]